VATVTASICFAHLVEHLAEILVLFGVGKLGQVGAAPFGIHIAQGHDVLAAAAADARAPLPADADAGHVQFVIGRHSAIQTEDVTGQDRNGGDGRGSVAEKTPPRDRGQGVRHGPSLKDQSPMYKRQGKPNHQ
jgi:hypothetical protein